MVADKPETTSFHIKSFPVEVRILAVNCAERRDETMAVWAARAFRAQANLEAGDMVLPPGAPDKPTDHPPSRQPHGEVDLGELAALLQAIAAVQATGVRGAKTAGSHALAVVTDQLRAVRGLPVLAPRLPPRQTTKVGNGQTIDAEPGLRVLPPGLPERSSRRPA